MPKKIERLSLELASDVFGVLLEFLTANEFIELSHVSKSIYMETKPHKFYYMNMSLSLEFCFDEYFREIVRRSLIMDKQLSLNLSGCRNVVDVSALGGVHTLNLSGCNISDVRALGGVNTLTLCGCDNVVDVSALGRVHNLSLGDCNVTDVNALGSVHTLNLSGCRNVVDVSALGGVHSLVLVCCVNVSDDFIN